MARLDQSVPLVLRDRQDLKDQQGLMAQSGRLVQPDRRAHRVLRDHKGPRAQPVLTGRWGLQAHPAQSERKDPPVPQGRQVHPELRALRGSKVL